MAYHFRLETLLDYRLTMEEQAQHRLAKELAALENHKRRLEELGAIRSRLIQEVEERKQRGIMASLYLFYMEAIRYKDIEITMQRNTIEAQKKVVVDARLNMVEKKKEREVVEKVKEKDYQAYIQEELKKELHENDEQVLLRFGRVETLI